MFKPLALTFFLSLPLVLFSEAANARTLRAFLIPQASTPAQQDCRFELEQRFTPQRKAADQGGEFFEYSAGYECHIGTFEMLDLEAGLDYVEAHDIRATNPLAPLQFNARVTYGARDEQGWSAALGWDNVGFKAGQNNFNVLYFVGQHRVENWQVALGAYAGNDDVLRTGDGKKEPNGAMVGAWRTIGRGRVGFEWQSGQNRFGYGALGAEVTFDERLTASLAYAIANDRALMRDWVLLRVQLR